MSVVPTESLYGDEALRQAALDAYAIVDTPPEQAFEDIVRLAVTACAVPAAVIAFADHDRLWFKARIGLDIEALPRGTATGERAIVGRSVVEIPDLAESDRGLPGHLMIDGRPLRFFAGAPLLEPGGYVLGAVCVADVVPRRLTPPQREALELLARQTAHLLDLRRYAAEQRQLLFEREAFAQRIERSRAELQQRNDQLMKNAGRDELTGLLNRSALTRLREDEAAMERLSQAAYSLILLDVDHFKKINDRHGHLLGDRALRVVADAVSESVREGDVAVRYGGEEFLILLPGTTLAHAAEVAHRIRSRIGESPLPFGLTVSAGIASGDVHERQEEVFERADQALYRAKAGGRNRVVVDDTPRLTG